MNHKSTPMNHRKSGRDMFAKEKNMLKKLKLCIFF